jgi:hypothetical protein
MKINIFSRATPFRDNTRAGFESAPLVSVEKGRSSIIGHGPPLSTVRYGDTYHPRLLFNLIRRHVLLKGLVLSLNRGL